MEETGRRLLDALAQNFGRPLTVRGVADEAKALHGTAHYANTYNELQKMKAARLIRWERTGRSSVIQLDPASPSLPDYVLQLEAWKRLTVLHERPDAAPKIQDLANQLRTVEGLQSAWLLEARRSIRLNRLSVLLLVEGLDKAGRPRLGRSFRWDAAIDEVSLSEAGLQARFGSPHVDPLRAWFASSINLLGADRHWLGWLDAAARGAPIRLRRDDPRVTPAIIGASLAYYGYEEFGTMPTQASILTLEALVVHVLRAGTARQRKAVPGLLEKNAFDPALLAFMARREGLGLAKRLPKASRNPRVGELRLWIRKGHKGD